MAALTTSACSGDAPAEVTPTASDFAAVAAGALEDAKAAHSTQAQLEAIEAAIADGSVSLEAVSGAVTATFDCFSSTGVRYEDRGSHTTGGVTYLDYVYEAGDKEAAADACMNQNSAFLESLYALQPSTLEAKDAAFVAAMPGLIKCLRDLGYVVDADVTADELKVIIEGDDADLEAPGGKEAAGARVGCLRDTGIDGW